MEWRIAKGDISFSILKVGWFEISFSNHVDFNRVWEFHPYHVFSQLLLLKPWHPSFDPSRESILPLDLWVRLHLLPEEFANSEALTTIIEGNFAGSFLKKDPTHNNNRMNMFTRFCINTDVALDIGKRIIIPDENCNPIKYKLWFDDFPDGCGACGFLDHVFEVCPNRTVPIPILQITIRKTTSNYQTDQGSSASSSANLAWSQMGKNNIPIKNPYPNLVHQNKPYLVENSRVKITYESEDSNAILLSVPDHDPELEVQPQLILVSDGIPDMVINVDHLEHVENQDTGYKNNTDASSNIGQLDTNNYNLQVHGKDAEFSQDDLLEIPDQNYILNTSLLAELGLPAILMNEMTTANQLNNTSLSPAEAPPIEEFDEVEPMIVDSPNENEEENYLDQEGQAEEEYYEEDDEEPFEDDDTFLNLENEQESRENTPSNPTGRKLLSSPIIMYEPEFTEQEVDDFINNSPIPDPDQPIPSKTSFHSVHNSMNSSSTMVPKINGLEVSKMEKSTSTSSKRKNNDGMDDTASSAATGGKNQRSKPLIVLMIRTKIPILAFPVDEPVFATLFPSFLYFFYYPCFYSHWRNYFPN